MPARFVITKKHLRLIKELAFKGLLKKQIATALGISPKTQRTVFREFPEAQNAFEQGQLKLAEMCHRNVLNTLRNGNSSEKIAAAKFIEKYYLRLQDDDDWDDHDED